MMPTAKTGDGVACVTDLALQDHAHNGEHKAEVGDELLILGQGDLLLTGVESLFLGLGNGVIRQDLVGQDAPHQEADGQAQVDQRELDQIDVCRNACAFQNGDHDAVLQSGVEGQQRVVCCKARRHQNPGRGQLLGVGQSGQQADDQHIVGGGTGAEQAAAQHNDEDQQDVGLKAAFAGHVEHGLLELDDEAGLLQGRNDGHEGCQHDDGGVCEAAEGGLDVGNAEHHQQQQRQQRGCTEGQFIHHDQDDHEDSHCQSNDHGKCHRTFPPFLCPQYLLRKSPTLCTIPMRLS